MDKIRDLFVPDPPGDHEIRDYYSLCHAAFKTRFTTGEFDEEAFLFFLLNNEAARSEIVLSGIKSFEGISLAMEGNSRALEKLTSPEKVALDVLAHFRGSLRETSLPGTGPAAWSGFLTGIFHKQQLPDKIEPELEEFINEALDNFWCLINEEQRNDLPV